MTTHEQDIIRDGGEQMLIQQGELVRRWQRVLLKVTDEKDLHQDFDPGFLKDMSQILAQQIDKLATLKGLEGGHDMWTKR